VLAVVGLVGLCWPCQCGAGGQLHFGGGGGGRVAAAAAILIVVVVVVVVLEVRSLLLLPVHGGKNLRQPKIHLL
jgi:hypothetical protein